MTRADQLDAGVRTLSLSGVLDTLDGSVRVKPASFAYLGFLVVAVRGTRSSASHAAASHGARPPVSLRYDSRMATCAAPGCTNVVARHAVGRPGRFCSTACRVRDHRRCQRIAAASVTIEVDMGSASSRGRLPERAWLVRIRRADRAVIVAVGLRRSAADRLAEQLTELLT
jgi:hypothetical protein